MVSIVIPSRNEPYLRKTIQDILLKATGQIEVIAVLDGYWPAIGEFVNDKRVRYIHFTDPRGMRNAINAGVAVANYDCILKCDAHVMFEKDFDSQLVMACHDDYVIVPRRYALDPEKWERIDNPKYPIDYMYLSHDLHGVVWEEKNKDVTLQNKKLDSLMSSQGSCWFMHRDYYYELELMDEVNYGTFASEFQEIGLKCWLSGGRVIVDKNTWYAHWHKTESRGYTLDKVDGQKAVDYVEKWRTGKIWHNQIHELSWLIDLFKPVPTWEEKI